jgi:hypothetical protein
MTGSTSRYLGTLLLLPVAWLAVTLPGFGVRADLEGRAGPAVNECGVRLVEASSGATPLLGSSRVVVVTDEEWRTAVPDADGTEARSVIFAAASLFRGIGIHLLPIRDVAWESPDDADTIEGIFEAAAAGVPLRDADFAIVLSAQPRSTTRDGYTEVGGSYVAVGHHPTDPGLDAFVLAHEVSHLFGAHHACDVPGRGGLMAERGFDELICPCTREVLELNAHRFHEEP